MAIDSAIGWIRRLVAAHDTGRLNKKLKRLRRYRLIVVDEVGYLSLMHRPPACSSNRSRPSRDRVGGGLEPAVLDMGPDTG